MSWRMNNFNWLIPVENEITFNMLEYPETLKADHSFIYYIIQDSQQKLFVERKSNWILIF